jgi:hypothetical protein
VGVRSTMPRWRRSAPLDPLLRPRSSTGGMALPAGYASAVSIIALPAAATLFMVMKTS